MFAFCTSTNIPTLFTAYIADIVEVDRRPRDGGIFSFYCPGVGNKATFLRTAATVGEGEGRGVN